jgi:COP9 signalosome complex subunit 7
MTATLNPAAQTVVITSVSPLRDLAPGSVETMMAELGAWSQRCDSVLSELEAEIAKVKANAAKRRREELRVEKQVKGVMEAEKGGTAGMSSRGGHNTRGATRGYQDDDDDDDAMDVDGGLGLGGKKKGGAGAAINSMLGRFSGRTGGR